MYDSTSQIAGLPLLRSPGEDDLLLGYSFGLWVSDPSIHPGRNGPELSDQGAFGCTPWVGFDLGHSVVLLIKDRTRRGTEPTVSGADSSIPIPLDVGTGTYKGLPLGLYENPIAPAVTPVDGVIGLVCIGMSNADQECDDFTAKLVDKFAGQVNRR